MEERGINREIYDAMMKEMVGSYEVSAENVSNLCIPGKPVLDTSRMQTLEHDSQSIPRPISVGTDGRSSRSSSRRRSRSPLRSGRRYRRNLDRCHSRSLSSDSGSEDYRLTGCSDRSPHPSNFRKRDTPRNRERGARSRERSGGNVRQRGLPKCESRYVRGVQDRGGAAPNFDQRLTRSDEEENKMKAIMVEADAVSRLGVHLIRWAGFHTISGDEFTDNSLPHCQLDTEACAKMLTSFKCSLKPEHRTHCFRYVRNLSHPAFSAPRLDTDFLNLLVEKGAVESREAFCEIINPLDQHLLTLQVSLLKCAHPMFLACNDYELNVKKVSETRGQLITALEKIIALCRKTLVLLGLSYSLTSSFRQEKILEAVNLNEAAPKPSDFPNLEDSLLFGKEYMTKLRNWIDKSRHPVQITYNLLTLEQKQQQALQAKLAEVKGARTADPLAIQTIDCLLEYNVKHWGLEGSDEGKPQFWFLFDESSVEYKYYRLKMMEMQKLKRATTDAKVQADGPHRSPEDMANESVRAMILARKTAAVKKKIFRDVAITKKRKIQRLSVGTQTDFKGPLVQELPASFEQSIPRPTVPGDHSKSIASETSVESKLLEVDANTKETAENLARFLVEMGPELAGFNLDILYSNPEFWFLNDKQSPAYEFYYKKLTEFRQASGLSYDPHQSNNTRKVDLQDLDSKIVQPHDADTSSIKPLVHGIYDSDREILDPQKPLKQAAQPLVSYGSENELSDTESPSHSKQEAIVNETQPNSLQDCEIESLCSQKPPPPDLNYQHPQCVDEAFQTDDQKLHPQDQKPELHLPQHHLSKDLSPLLPPPQVENPQLSLSHDLKYQLPLPQDLQDHKLQCQDHTPPSQAQMPHFPEKSQFQEPRAQDRNAHPLHPTDLKPQFPLHEFQEYQVLLSQDQKPTLPLAQDPKQQVHCPESQNQAPQDQKSQYNLTQYLKPQPQWTPPLLLQDQKPQLTLSEDKLQQPQNEKLQPQYSTTEPRDQKFQKPSSEFQKPQSHDLRPHFPLPFVPAPPPLFLDQKPLHPLSQDPKPQLPFPHVQRPPAFFFQGQNPQLTVPQYQKPQYQHPAYQPPYRNPQALIFQDPKPPLFPPQNQNPHFIFSSDLKPQQQGEQHHLPFAFDQKPPFLPVHQQKPLFPVTQYQTYLQQHTQDQKPPLPLAQEAKTQSPTPHDQRHQHPVIQNLYPQPTPLNQTPLLQDSKPQTALLQDQKSQTPALEDTNAETSHTELPQVMNPQSCLPQNQKCQSPPIQDQKQQYPLSRDFKPPVSLPQDGKSPLYLPNDGILQPPLPQIEKSESSLSEDQMTQTNRPKDPSSSPHMPPPLGQNLQPHSTQCLSTQTDLQEDLKINTHKPKDCKPEASPPQPPKPPSPGPQTEKPETPLPEPLKGEPHLSPTEKPQPLPTQNLKPANLLPPHPKLQIHFCRNLKSQTLFSLDRKPQTLTSQNQKCQIQKSCSSLPQVQKTKSLLAKYEKPQTLLPKSQSPQYADLKPQASVSHSQNPEIILPQNRETPISLPKKLKSETLLFPERKSQSLFTLNTTIKTTPFQEQTSPPQDQKLQTPLPKDKKLLPALPQDSNPNLLLTQNWKSETILNQNLKSETILPQSQTPQSSFPQHWKAQTPFPQNQNNQNTLAKTEKPPASLLADQKAETPHAQNQKPHPLLSQHQKVQTPIGLSQKPQNPFVKHHKSETTLPQDRKPQPVVSRVRSFQTTLPQEQKSKLALTQSQKPLQDLERLGCIVPDTGDQFNVGQDIKPSTSGPYNSAHQISERRHSRSDVPEMCHFRRKDSKAEYSEVLDHNPLFKSSKHKRLKHVPEEASSRLQEEIEFKCKKSSTREEDVSSSPTHAPRRRKKHKSSKASSKSSKRQYAKEDKKVSGKSLREKSSKRQDSRKKESIQAEPIVIRKWTEQEAFSQERGCKEVPSLGFGEKRVVRDPGNVMVTSTS
ncbi:uncharacterized protein [Ambystoma mexicanum]|uniref:uncharacterized protein isoform X2 n=1 Tax=Ambystoma mexicanum TaxID=8296 RepID=UPI0037E848B3